MAEITDLFIYPVKSLRGIRLTEASVGVRGFRWDRLWMVVDENGRFVTQRNIPAMAQISVDVTQHSLIFRHDDHDDCHVALVRSEGKGSEEEGNNGAVQVTVWGDDCDAFDEGEQISRWLTLVLGTWRDSVLRLVRFDESTKRRVEHTASEETQAHTAFSDGFPYLVTSQASLDALNTVLVNKGSEKVSMDRFRPNIVLKGTGPFEEDRIRSLLSPGQPDIRLALCKPCQRCKVTSIDQQSGVVKEVKEPLSSLIAMKTQPDLKGAYFGQNAILMAGEGGVLKVGDRLEVSTGE